MSFLKSLNRLGSGNMCFTIEGDLDILGDCCMVYNFAAGVHLEGEEVAPDQLPTYYVFQGAKTD